MKYFFFVPDNGLRLMKVSIPGYKLRGEMAILECDYELDGEILYAVKWYKDNEEFYRFVPKSNPPQHSYKVDGIKVDVSNISFYFSCNRSSVVVIKCSTSLPDATRYESRWE